jgi:hypothetical protein
MNFKESAAYGSGIEKGLSWSTEKLKKKIVDFYRGMNSLSMEM